MISPEGCYKKYLKGKTKEQIMTGKFNILIKYNGVRSIDVEGIDIPPILKID